MSANHEVIVKMLEIIPQYPEQITRHDLCEKLGIKDMTLNSYLCSATSIAMICEDGPMLSRCEAYYA